MLEGLVVGTQALIPKKEEICCSDEAKENKYKKGIPPKIQYEPPYFLWKN